MYQKNVTHKVTFFLSTKYLTIKLMIIIKNIPTGRIACF